MSDREAMTRVKDVPPLDMYYFYLTDGCNLACRHCWLAPRYQPDGASGRHLPFELFMQAIDEGIPLGLRQVKLTGGEPLLHPNFKPMIAYLKQKKLGVNIETNGLLLTEEMVNGLKDSGVVNHISVSIDGAAAGTHDTFRGVKGSFEKACAGVRLLATAGMQPQIIMSLHDGNVMEIEGMIHLAEEMSAASLKFNIVQPTGRGEIMIRQGQALDVGRLIALGRWIESDLQEKTSVDLFFDYPMAFYNLRRLLQQPASSCGIFGILGILCTGHMAMCGIGVAVPELVYGKVGVERVVDVWNHHPMLIDLRNGLKENLEGVCGACIFKQQCLGNCVAENFHQTRRLTAPFWFCRQASEAGLFPLSRIKDDIYLPRTN